MSAASRQQALADASLVFAAACREAAERYAEGGAEAVARAARRQDGISDAERAALYETWVQEDHARRNGGTESAA